MVRGLRDTAGACRIMRGVYRAGSSWQLKIVTPCGFTHRKRFRALDLALAERDALEEIFGFEVRVCTGKRFLPRWVCERQGLTAGARHRLRYIRQAPSGRFVVSVNLSRPNRNVYYARFTTLVAAMAARDEACARHGIRTTQRRTSSAASIEQMLLDEYTYDPTSGVVRRKLSDAALRPNVSTGYVVIRCTFGGRERQFKAHRFAFLAVTGAWPAGVVDHINGVRHDNRWVNLRDVSRAENNKNTCIVPEGRDVVRRGGSYFRLVPL